MPHYEIGEHYESFIRKMVDTRGYQSSEDVIIRALRMLEAREAVLAWEESQLIPEIQAGRDAPAEPITGVLSRLQSKYTMSEHDGKHETD